MPGWMVATCYNALDSTNTRADDTVSRYWEARCQMVKKPNSEGRTATAGSDVVQSGRPIFDDFFQHLWPSIGNNTANGVFQRVMRLWLIRIDQ
ncbi:hypothetical protein TNCV_4854851 [Trichonephila clavipes]|nr:hypothetical protein TNCV_4854851 [Trichonephila clavipes]